MFFMPDNLRISTPVANTEGINKPNPAGEPPRLNPINPNRVPKTANEEDTGRQAADLLLNRSSVYSQFIRQLGQTPDLSRTLQKLLGDAVVRQGLSPLGQAGAASLPADSPLRALVASIVTRKEGILENLALQQDDRTLFSGALFRLLGQISQKGGDAQFDLRLADFLKAFNGYYTAADTTQAVLGDLEQLKSTLPLPFAKKLAPLLEKLSGGADADHVNADLTVIKREIIPLLGRYVAKTNDYGKSRDIISLFLHNTAILNESSRENLGAKYDQLLRYCRENLKLPDATVGMLQSLFAEEIYTRRQAKRNEFLDALTSLLSHATDKTPPDGLDKTALHDICRSLLLDSSVYMPFHHIFLPADIDGRFFFTQIWIEKKEPDEDRRRGGGRGPEARSVYLTFDIQDLGYFEASIRMTGKQVDLKLACPPALNGFRGEIRAEITRILQDNGFSAENIRLSPSAEPQIPRIIMEKIQERKHAIDVSV